MAGEIISLDDWHDQLNTHFANLRAQRDQLDPQAPLFALEHGLAVGERMGLFDSVRRAIANNQLSSGTTWLPVVVYAAELGYEYSGDEYWDSFAAKTPGWREKGQRDYIKRCFLAFRDQFRGAVPVGPFARNFTIICWPITHAVLPTDLQRQLARLLFESRGGLTADLLAEPELLGRFLAARTLQASNRFTRFAENTALLGHIAAALLAADDDPYEYLLESTLERIVADIKREREAQRWLRGAQKAAVGIREKGALRGRGSDKGRTREGVTKRRAALTDPELYLVKRGAVWVPHLRLPEFSSLVDRFPDLGAELRGHRTLVAGVARSPLPRSALLYPGEPLPIDKWPRANTQLISLENGGPTANEILRDQCMLSTSPWLFAVRESRQAVEIRGKSVRPGRSYIVLCAHRPALALPEWIEPAECSAVDAHAYAVAVPDILRDEHLAVLNALELAVISDLAVRPVGVVPALWDGEGRTEWLAGDEPMFAISSGLTVTAACVEGGGETYELTWPAGDREIFLRLGDVAIGSHEIHVSMVFAADQALAAEVALEVTVRAPAVRPARGTMREGLMVVSDPVMPTMDELWDGRAEVTLIGPAGTDVAVTGSLTDVRGREIANRSTVGALPMDGRTWTRLFGDEIRDGLEAAYDDAEALDIRVAHAQLGAVVLRCEREFAPVRWSAGEDRDGPYVRLINNSEYAATVICHPFDRPAIAVDTGFDDAEWRVRREGGGLIVAKAGGAAARVVLAPTIPRDFKRLRDLNVTPTISACARTATAVTRLVKLAGAWESAVLTANVFAAVPRNKAVEAIRTAIAELITQGRWAGLERRIAHDADRVTITELVSDVGRAPYQVAVAKEICSRLEEFATLDGAVSAAAFADVLARRAPQLGNIAAGRATPDFVLRVASRPSTIADAPTSTLTPRLEALMDSPFLLRAARLIVILAEAGETKEAGGWRWK